MNNFLNEVDWNSLLSDSSIKTNWLLFKDLLIAATKRYVPTEPMNSQKLKPPWGNKSLASDIAMKRELYLKYMQTSSHADYDNYVNQRSLVKSRVRSAQISYEDYLINKMKTNPKALYIYVKCKQKVISSIPPLEKSDGSLTANNQEAANVLVSFFETTFINEDVSSLPEFSERLGNCYLSDVYISKEVVFHKLCNLKPYKSPGPDSLHSYILKACASHLTEPLCILFKQSLKTGHIPIPNDWKCANITLVFKKGSKSNYQPISLTSQVVKILESIVRDTIQDFLLQHNVINPLQHGFRQGKSCLTNLLRNI